MSGGNVVSCGAHLHFTLSSLLLRLAVKYPVCYSWGHAGTDVGVSLLVSHCWLCHPIGLSQSTISAWPGYPRDPVTSTLYSLPYRPALLAHLRSQFLFLLAVCGLVLDSEWTEDISLKAEETQNDFLHFFFFSGRPNQRKTISFFPLWWVTDFKSV